MEAPPVPFIVGVSRSGSTLLRAMLDSHRDMAIPFESHFVHKLIRGTIGKENFLAIVTASPSFPNMTIEVDALRASVDALMPFSVPDALRAFYRLSAARSGKSRFGDKTPTYLHHMPAIQEILPEAHFLHIIRDGRDTALSFRGLWFGPGNDAAAAAEFWRDEIVRARRQACKVEHYLELRYEDLVLQPEPTLMRICRFLQLDFDSAMLEFHHSGERRLDDIKRPFGPNGAENLDIEAFRAIYANIANPLDPDRIGRWRFEMSLPDQQRFEGVAGELLRDLGYETCFD